MDAHGARTGYHELFHDGTPFLHGAVNCHLSGALPSYQKMRDDEDTSFSCSGRILPSNARLQCSSAWMNNAHGFVYPSLGSFPMAYDAFGRVFFIMDTPIEYYGASREGIRHSSTASISGPRKSESTSWGTDSGTVVDCQTPPSRVGRPDCFEKVPGWLHETAGTGVAAGQHGHRHQSSLHGDTKAGFLQQDRLAPISVSLTTGSGHKPSNSEHQVYQIPQARVGFHTKGPSSDTSYRTISSDAAYTSQIWRGVSPTQTAVGKHPLSRTKVYNEKQANELGSNTGAKAQYNPELESVWERNQAFQCFAQLVEEHKRQDNNHGLSLQPRPQFKRSRQVLEQEGNSVTYPRAENPRYLGNPNSKSFKTQINFLPDQDNCALWITNIPSNADYPDVFPVLNVGAVFCLHLNSPDEKHSTKAAKLAFTTPWAAAAFLSRTRSPHGICIFGHRIVAIYNRHGYREYEYRTIKSRVLHITGPASLMSVMFWDSYFRHCAVIQWEDIRELRCEEPDKKCMEFRFARIDAQAESCYEAIKRDEKCAGVFEVRYGMDPCDPQFGW